MGILITIEIVLLSILMIIYMVKMILDKQNKNKGRNENGSSGESENKDVEETQTSICLNKSLRQNIDELINKIEDLSEDTKKNRKIIKSYREMSSGIRVINTQSFERIESSNSDIARYTDDLISLLGTLRKELELGIMDS